MATATVLGVVSAVVPATEAQASSIGPRFALNSLRTHGAWNVDQGTTYVVSALAKNRPEYIDATPYPQRPSGNDYYFVRTGTVHGQGLWELSVTMTKSLRTHRYWNIGIRTGTTLHRVKIRVLAKNDPAGAPLSNGGSTHHA